MPLNKNFYIGDHSIFSNMYFKFIYNVNGHKNYL